MNKSKRNIATRPATAAVSEPSEQVTGEPSLENIRAESLQRRTDSHRTIAELEAWRDEIEATIAFLKAQRK